ncbi:MAG: DUF1330 domain-containing protein [Chromatiales bacterium]|nr:DUF1330 domain-containing protein [Chromatiales bacterium]
MSAYVIAEVEVTDPETFEEYRSLVPATIEAFGGRYVVRGGPIEGREGGWQPKRIVVIEFDDATRAKAWHDSDLYAPARALREASARTRMIVVEGV